MKKEAKTLLAKSVDSLVLAVDHFNRAWDRGRTETVLILMDRAFELLLKATIVHKGGEIRESRDSNKTIGFDTCLRRCLSNAELQCLTEDEVIALQAMNTLRDAAQHYMVEVSEEHLYIYAQSGLTLFVRVAREHLGYDLRAEIPERILPICARPPRDLSALFEAEFADIRRMVAPGSRKRLDAKAKLRALAILQASMDGRKSQPSDKELDAVVKRINDGEGWRELFPGVATLVIDPEGAGPGISLRVTKNQGEAVRLVNEGDPNAAVVALRKVNDLDFYAFGASEVARRVGVTQPKLLCLVDHDGVRENRDLYKEFQIGRSLHKRYSNNAVTHLRRRLGEVDIEEIWRNRRR